MTFILSRVHPITGLLTISDTVVSTKIREGAEPVAVDLPFSNDPVQHANGGYGLAGLRQKTVVFGRSMVMWSGTAFIARAVIETIRQVSGDGERRIELQEAFDNSDVSASQLSEIGLIYHYNTGPDHIYREAWNCSYRAVEAGGETIADASGVGYFLDNLYDENRTGAVAHNAALQSLMMKIASHAISETTNRETLDHLYGGWFEMTYKGETGFEKVPYAIKLWTRKEGWLGSGGPAVMCWYSDHTLVLTRVRRTEADNDKQEVDHRSIADFLSRDGAWYPPASVVRPFEVVHIVYDEDHKLFYTNVGHGPLSEGFIFEIGPGGIRLSWTDKLREQLYSMRPHTVPSEMKRRWDP